MDTILEDINDEAVEFAIEEFETESLAFFTSIGDLLDAAVEAARQRGYAAGYADAMAVLAVGDPAEVEEDDLLSGDCPCDGCRLVRVEENQTADAVYLEAIGERLASLEARLEEVEGELY